MTSVGVGTDESGNTLSKIDLYPGSFWESIIRTSNYCKGKGLCPAEFAGLYDLIASQTVVKVISDDGGVVWSGESQHAFIQGGLALQMVDVMRMNTSQGLQAVEDCLISTINEERIKMPNGQEYFPQVGMLSVGHGLFSAPFENVTGQNFHGYLANKGVIPSNSFGLHYDSATLGLEASLVFGGYDQSRVIGNVGSFRLYEPGFLIMPTLLDIQIRVESGSSPFEPETDFYPGLLHLNRSIGSFQPTVISPQLPYLFMSPETCKNIGKHLPVTLEPGIGLYTWNINDPQYKQIIQSPSYLVFVFQYGSLSSSSNLTIKIPFQLLNLTLEDPIVPIRQQYFPCQPFHALDGTGRYYLGRALLQAAFFGVNWEQQTYFLAQAPGPMVNRSNVRPIAPKDTAIYSNPISDFAVTWSKHWSPLTASKNKNSPSSNSSNVANIDSAPHSQSSDGSVPSNMPNDNSKSDHTSDALTADQPRLSKGTVTAISVVAAMALIGLLILGSWYFCYGRRRSSKGPPNRSYGNQSRLSSTVQGLFEKDGTIRRFEAGGDKGLPHEAPADSGVYEK